MRSKLGLTSVIALIISLGALGTPSSLVAAPADDSVPAETSTTVEVTTTEEGTAPVGAGAPADEGLVIDGPARVDAPRPVSRPASRPTIEPVPPLPTTTTTTVPPPPPSWVLPANSGTGRRVVYSKGRQRVWAVDSAGNVIKTHLVSGNLHWAKPQLGTYSVFSRSRYTYALSNPTIRWGYMVRFAHGPSGDNIGFHEIPTQYGYPVQSVSQLGTPLSGGCVRQAVSDAIWMWNWAYIGTKVVVIW